MKISEKCKCQISGTMKFVKNDNFVGMIGTNVPDKITRHATKLCPIKQHQITSYTFSFK